MIAIRYSREDRLWTVGLANPAGEKPAERFYGLRDFDSADAAACYVNWLNGGTGDPFVERVKSR